MIWNDVFYSLPCHTHCTFFCTKLTLFCRCIAHIRTYRDMYGMKHSPNILYSFAREVWDILHLTLLRSTKQNMLVCVMLTMFPKTWWYTFLEISSVNIKLMVHPQFSFCPEGISVSCFPISHRRISFKLCVPENRNKSKLKPK